MTDSRIVPLADAKRREQARNQPADVEPDAPDDSEFRPLGHNHGNYYFLARRSGQIIEASGRMLTNDGVLLGLAPLHYWEREFPKKGGFDKSAAVNSLIQSCLKARVFNVDRLRGRGAWWDAKRVVLHLGDHLLVDGERTPVAAFKTEYIYEEAASFGISPGPTLANPDAKKFLELCQMLRWERPYMATLLAGWCVIAPICGALAWRPHLWLVGESGSGKSWIQENIVQAALSGIALAVQSKTTEAGLRQALKSDARPVIFDEAEAENPRDRERLQQILDLARAASTESGPAIAKGGQEGRGQQYRVRAAMCFSSINPVLKQQADENRFTVLQLLAGEGNTPETKKVIAEHFDLVRATVAATLTKDFSLRLLSRSLALLPTIRANAETYATAATEIMPSRRNGDQIGAMLAGAAALHHARRVTLDEARDSIKQQGWLEDAAIEAMGASDHERLLSYICQQAIPIRMGNASVFDRTFGDLIHIAINDPQNEPVSQEEANSTLRRYGIKVGFLDDDTSRRPYVWFANSHSMLARVLRDTQWTVQWAVSLGRCPGAVKPKNPVRFGRGAQSRAVGIPFSVINH